MNLSKRESGQIMGKQIVSGKAKSAHLGGANTVASILNFMDASATEKVMNKITAQRAELAQEIQENMFTFNDLIDVDNLSIQTLLREVATNHLLLALHGVDAELKEKFFSNMSKRAAETLRDDLDSSPPAKLSDVKQSQKEILNIAKCLAESGKIRLGGGTDEFI